MSGFNQYDAPKRPRVTFEEKRARQLREANYARAQAAGAGPLAPLFGIEPRAVEVQAVRVQKKQHHPPVRSKHRELYEAVLALKPGEAYEWPDAPAPKVVHTRLTDWRKRLGLKLEAFESCGRRFVRRVAV